MAKATERIFLPILKFQMPQMVNLNLPLSGVFHNCAIVSVKNDFPGAGVTVMNGIWGMGQMRYTKLIITVDADIDPYDTDKVYEAVLKNVDFDKDLIYSKGPLDALDHSSDSFYGTRLGIDATTKAGRDVSCGTMAVVTVKKQQPWDGHRGAQEALKSRTDKLIIIVDDTEDPNDMNTIMWRVFNNIDASRDVVTLQGRAAVDATKKIVGEGLQRPWPEDIVMTEEMKKLVDRKWQSYGL